MIILILRTIGRYLLCSLHCLHAYFQSYRNPATYEEAIKGDKPGIWIYSASKKLAETAAFNYAKEHPELQVTTINRK